MRGKLICSAESCIWAAIQSPSTNRVDDVEPRDWSETLNQFAILKPALRKDSLVPASVRKSRTRRRCSLGEMVEVSTNKGGRC